MNIKKYFLLVLIVVSFVFGCGYAKTQEPNFSHLAVNVNSEDYKFRAYALQKAVAAYAKSIKYSRDNCQMTSAGVAKCFSKKMSGSTAYNNIVKDSYNDTWKFIATNNCQNRGDCKIIVNTDNGEFTVVLWKDADGFLTTDNPSSPY